MNRFLYFSFITLLLNSCDFGEKKSEKLTNKASVKSINFEKPDEEVERDNFRLFRVGLKIEY
jgi:hypothetical protein